MGKRVRTHVNPLSITREEVFGGFGNSKSIIIDVGAFKGEFSHQLCERLPDHNFILFEIRIPIYQKLCKKFEGFPNVRVFPGDAARNFQSILQPCLDEGAKIKYIFINFPDPWLKEKHKKRRFVREDYLKNWSEWLNPDALFVFQTDQPTLFDDTLEIINQSPYNHHEAFQAPPFGVQTDWEKAKTSEGSSIHRMVFGSQPIKPYFDETR